MNTEKKAKIPSAPIITTSGNLLSNVAPPTQLPNFVTTVSTPVVPVAQTAESVNIDYHNFYIIFNLKISQDLNKNIF